MGTWSCQILVFASLWTAPTCLHCKSMTKVKTLGGIPQTLDSTDLHLLRQGEHSRSSFFTGKEIGECWYFSLPPFFRCIPFSRNGFCIVWWTKRRFNTCTEEDMLVNDSQSYIISLLFKHLRFPVLTQCFPLRRTQQLALQTISLLKYCWRKVMGWSVTGMY
jgi:hypothetical protein